MADSRVEKWRAWIDGPIAADVHDMHLQRATYRRVQEIVAANGRLPRDSYYWEYLESTYATAQAVAVRRQAELDIRVRSLGQLLREVAVDAGRVTRDSFVAMWVDPDDRDETRLSAVAQIADSTFSEKFAGEVGDRLDPAIALRDLAALADAAASVKAFVDERIAHSDRRAKSALPTFAELDRALDRLGELLITYTLLFTARGLMKLEPVIQEDWEAVFRQPWIVAADRR